MGFCQPAASRAAPRTSIRLSSRKQLSCPNASPSAHSVAFMPEKRQFFLESAGVFAFPIGICGVRISSFLARLLLTRYLGLVLVQISPNLGPMWVQLIDSKISYVNI